MPLTENSRAPPPPPLSPPPKHLRSFWPSGTLLPLLEWMTGFIAGRGETTCAEDPELGELLTRRALALTQQVLRCPSYAGASAPLTLNLAARRQVGQQADMAAAVRAGLQGWWAQAGRRPVLLRALVTDRFPLSGDELADWATAPETFHHEMMTTAWEDSTHGCAENLAVALFEVSGAGGRGSGVLPGFVLGTRGAATPRAGVHRERGRGRDGTA